MTTTSTRQSVATTLDAIRQRTPAYIELADRFGPLFLAVAQLGDELIEQGVTTPPVDTARVAAGVPVLAGLDLTPWSRELSRSAKRILPELCTALAVNEELRQPLLQLLSDEEMIVTLVQARIEGDANLFEQTVAEIEQMTPDALMYLVETVAVPVFRAMVSGLRTTLSSITWEEGLCPVCGSSPSISVLSPKEVTDLDQLVGGGGKKFLHCSLCGNDWRFKRNVCPSCGNDENDSREVFTAEDTQAERLEACHKCGKYCLNVDLRELEPSPDLDAMQLGLIHLDIFARDNELTPLTPTLWNTLD